MIYNFNPILILNLVRLVFISIVLTFTWKNKQVRIGKILKIKISMKWACPNIRTLDKHDQA